MAKLHNPTVGLLLTVLSLQGTRGDLLSVFSNAGGAATLPCNNVQLHYPNCSSTTWIFSRNGNVSTEEVAHGNIRPDNSHRSERLSVLSNCSLCIADVTTEDAGFYTCRQYAKGNKSKDDMFIYHSVLHITSRGTDRDVGSKVTLHCLLHTHYDCETVVYNRTVHLSWVDEEGVELQNTTHLQISRESPCSTTLTVQLRDPNSVHTQWTWTCLLTAGGQVQTSVDYTIIARVKPLRAQVVTRGPGAATTPECVFSVEIPIRLSIFFMVLIVPGLIGTVHLMRRRKQTSREASPAIELQVLN
ncbi:uncharacterized protein LOC143109680 [Alosa pseudoharengus]|uniref:uncharacterized protein LOC143109680 n=1 Tax=Alosa pseudoharengus TaxID=34774 RepID=UPI003F8C73AD